MSPIRPFTVKITAHKPTVTTVVEVGLDEQEEAALRRVATAVNEAAVGIAFQPRMYVERRFVGVRASGGAA